MGRINRDTAWTPPPGYTPAVFADLFPASLATPDFSHDKARVILAAPHTPDNPATARLYAFVDSPAGPSLAFSTEFDYQNIQGDLRQGFTLTTTAPTPQQPVTITPTSGCGCGSRLRSFRPWEAARMLPFPPTKPYPAPAPEGALL